MMNEENFRDVLRSMGFQEEDQRVFKKCGDATLAVDFNSMTFEYPSEITLYDRTTSNFGHAENFVVFECVVSLLEKGYRPADIELEHRWPLGHTQKGARPIFAY